MNSILNFERLSYLLSFRSFNCKSQREEKTMDKFNGLNDLCVFCYKSVEESFKPRTGERCQIVNLFCKFVSRICGKKFNVPENASCKLLATCEDCVTIIDSFNELCHQVECLKLQMEWRLDKLKNVMKCADKIPSRVKQFRNRYSIPSDSEQQTNGAFLDVDEYRQLRDTRNVIQFSVSEYLSNVFPRVQIETVRKSRDFDVSFATKLNRTQVQGARLPINVDPLLEWIKTVIAVTMCCFPIDSYHRKVPPSPSNSITFETSPELICESHTISEPVAAFNEIVTSLDLIKIEGKQDLDEILSSSPQSPDNFKDVATDVPPLGITQVHNPLEEDIKEMQTSFKTEHLERSPSAPSVQSCMETNADKHEDEMWTNLQALDNVEDSSKFDNAIPSTSRQLRFKFKCTICSLTFSTESRLNKHIQTCSKDYATDDDEEYGIFKNELSLHGSENEMEMEEDLDSNDSTGDLSDIEPNAEHEVSKHYEKSVSTSNLTAAGFHNWMKDINEGNATIPCPEESCTRKYFTQRDLSTHSKQHGIFRCNFCPVEKTFAPDLALHELQHASSSSSSVAKYKCSRCAYITNLKCLYLPHHLRTHLHMSPDTFTVACPVCPKNIKSSVLSQAKKYLTTHFLLKHTTGSGSTNDESEYEFMCQVTDCGKKFEFKCDLDSHTAWHSTNSSENGVGDQLIDGEQVEVLSCDVCSRKFVSLSELNLHKKIRHNPDGRQKGSVVISDDGVTVDDLLDASNAKWPCPVATCNLKFFTEDDLSSHAKLHGSFKCKFCPVVKSFAPELSCHEIIEHTKKTKSKFICSRCDYNGSTCEVCVVHHIKVHLNLPPDTITINCPICQQTFKKNMRQTHTSKGQLGLYIGMKSTLVGHFYTHHDKSMLIESASLFNCEHCPAYFLVQHQLLSHKQRMHPDHTSLSCADCCKQFQKRRQLLKHRTAFHYNNDESGYEFVCQVPNCSKRFEYDYDLQRHTSSHSRYSSKTCPECGKIIFDKSSSFDKHVKSHHRHHQGHACEQCGKMFKGKDKLTRHMLSHTGPDSWQFKCDICSVKCITKDRLKQHKRIHSKTKQYICETCGASYACRNSLMCHMIKKHGVADADFTSKNTKTKNFASRKCTKEKRETKHV